MKNSDRSPSASTKQIHVSPKTYKMLKHVAVDRDVRLLELTEQIIEAGVKIVIPDHQHAYPASAN